MDTAQLTNQFHAHKDEWVDTMARVGYVAKGVVYCLVGTLAALAAFNVQGGQNEGKKGVFQFLLSQPFGKVLLALVAVGLLAYVIWRLVEAVKDPRHRQEDSDAKDYVRRAGYVWSALIYGALAFYAASLVLGKGSSSGSSQDSGSQSGREFIVAKVLQLPLGTWLVGLAAAGTLGYGLYQIYRGITADFMKYINQQAPGAGKLTLYRRSGIAGYIARGIVLGIIGYLLLRAALQHNAQAAGGTESAFQFMQSTSIPFLMGAVALGLICYGLFMFVRARHQSFLR